MAHIDIVYVGHLLTVAVLGDLSSDEVIGVINEHYSNGIVKNVIWDLTEGSLANITKEGFKAIAKATLESLASGARQGGRTAFVGDKTAEYGLMRMYTAIAEMTGVKTQYNVFRTIDEAVIWLESQRLEAIKNSRESLIDKDRSG